MLRACDKPESVHLRNDDNRRLFERYWGGDRVAREQLIEANMVWVTRFATQTRIDFPYARSDLIDAARRGLIGAIDKYSQLQFDFAPDENLQGGYAIWWVRQAISRWALGNGLEYDVLTNAVSNSSTERRD